MKKTIIIKMVLMLAAVGFVVGCGEQGAAGSSASTHNNMEGAMYKLARMNGCIDCHRLNATVMGPSWEAIAERYKDAPATAVREMLIESVEKGSKGKWITWKAPEGMPAMERRVSSEHIVTLVDYIVSLNRAPGADAVAEPAAEATPVMDAATTAAEPAAAQ